MTLPSTITTQHGEYEWGGYDTNDYGEAIWRYMNGRKEAHFIDGMYEFSFDEMSIEEIIEFLQAYKEATKVTER